MGLFPLFLLIMKRIATLLAALLAFSACTSGGNKTVHLATWSNYISNDVVQQFQKETGYTLKLSHYSSNEELLAKLQAGASGYDVAVPSDYMVFTMIQLGLLQKLDPAKISFRSQIDSSFLGKKYDPQNEFALPYDWGTTGIAYRKDKVKTPIHKWSDLFTREDLKGKFSLLDDAREALGAVLKSQGKSLNVKDASEIEVAKKKTDRA
jgi:spermidine/putrescine-binding protein